MMSSKQATFRDEYRRRIENWYSPLLHVFVIYAIGFAALSLFVARLVDPIYWYQWAAVPLVAFVSNILEWAMHKYVMHRPRRNAIARAIYKRHTQMHHQFFTDKNYTIDAVRDFRIVFFPPYTEVAAMALAIPGSMLLGALAGANAGWLSMSTVVTLYMIYEFFHFCCHVGDNWFVRTMPLVNTIRRHHAAHHDHTIMMDHNMNLTFPVADWLFRTSDLHRSFLGTIFNGYSTRYVRTDMARKSRKPLAHAELNTAQGGQRDVSYMGERTIDGNIITRNHVVLDARLDPAKDSQVGLDWGFDGPAARRLATALLVDYLGDSTRAAALAPIFTSTIVAQFDNSWELTAADIEQALATFESR